VALVEVALALALASVGATAASVVATAASAVVSIGIIITDTTVSSKRKSAMPFSRLVIVITFVLSHVLL
jgi:TPP-dependent trihydroxycyclohexane-1,2-dione (THcHDO) dehydratase